MAERERTFNIPAQFVFQPFSAAWRIVSAETVEWVKELEGSLLSSPLPGSLRVRIELPDGSAPETVAIDRANLPRGVLLKHEDYRKTPYVSGRRFSVLICQSQAPPTIRRRLDLEDARTMRREFLSLRADTDSVWIQDLCQFLNKWGLWDDDKGFIDDWASPARRIGRLIVPHLLKEPQKIINSAPLSRNRRKWLSSHPLNLQTADEPPFFFVAKNYCAETIKATITIDHLEGLQFGICKKCNKLFQQKTRREKNYCDERCFNAAGTQRWRDKKREEKLNEVNRTVGA